MTKVCQMCGSADNLTKHHERYEGETFIIRILCRSCHNRVHGLFKEPDVKHLEKTIEKMRRRIDAQLKQIDDIQLTILSRSNSIGLLQGYLGVDFEKWERNKDLLGSVR